MRYRPKEIILLAKAITGDKASYKLLKEIKRDELAALSDTFRTNNKTSLKWLADNKFIKLSAFYYAFIGQKEAFDYLFKNKKYEWAAVLGVVKNDKKAFNWLLRHKLNHFALLAKTLIVIDERNNDQSVGGYERLTIGSAFSSFSPSGGGFGGFGGGGFGGGGAGGSW